MKKLLAIMILFALCLPGFAVPASAEAWLGADAVAIAAPSAVLMEKETGRLIYEKNSHERLCQSYQPYQKPFCRSWKNRKPFRN